MASSLTAEEPHQEGPKIKDTKTENIKIYTRYIY